MFDSESTGDYAWQPDGWDLEVPVEEHQTGPDGYTGGLDPALIQPTDHEEPYTEILDLPADAPLADAEGTPADDPEAVRSVIRAQCLADIKECLTEACKPPSGVVGSFSFKFTRESEVVQDMIRVAVRDDDAEAVVAHVAVIETLPGITYVAKVEANFASAVLGDPDAADLVHSALEAERAAALRQQEREHAGRPEQHTRPYSQKLDAIIKRCIDYNVLANHWIDKYAIDDEQRWAKTTDYLLLRRDQQDPHANPAVAQQQFDQHMAGLVETSPAATVGYTAQFLEHIVDPAVREQLVEHFVATVDGVPLSLETFAHVMRVGRLVIDDPELATSGRHDFFSRVYNMGGRALIGQHPYPAVIEALYPYNEAVMHSRGLEPDAVITYIDKLTGNVAKSQTPSPNQHQVTPMLMRDRWLASSALRFAQAGNFGGAQQLLSNMSPKLAQRGARAKCLELVTTADDLDALQLDPISLVAAPELGVGYEVAALRIAGDTEGLIAHAIGHARAISPYDPTQRVDMKGQMDKPVSVDGLTDTVHAEYVEAARRTIARMDPAQMPVFAKQVLPIIRSVNKIFSIRHMSPLSEALIASGDTDEPAAALAHINRPGTSDRAMRVEALWNLAKMLRRANEAGNA